MLPWYSIPLEALVTGCVSHCDSRVMWSYDRGEMSSMHHPGYPETVTPAEGCSDDHLDILDRYMRETYEGEVWRQVEHWWRLRETAGELWQQSRMHLGLTPCGSLAESLRLREQREAKPRPLHYHSTCRQCCQFDDGAVMAGLENPGGEVFAGYHAAQNYTDLENLQPYMRTWNHRQEVVACGYASCLSRKYGG